MPSPSVPAFTRHTLLVIALVALALFLWKIAPVLLLGFAGIVIATVVRSGSEPLGRWLRLSQPIAVAIVFLLGFAVVVAGGYFFGKQAAEQADQMWTAIGESGAKIKERLEESPVGSWVIGNAEDAADPEAMTKALKGTATVFGALADVVLVLFLALYFAADPATYKRGFLALVPRAGRQRVSDALDAAGTSLRQWLKGQLVGMVMVGLLTGLGLWAAGVPLALPLAVLSGLLDFVPFIGPLVAAVPGLMIAFSQGEDVALYAAIVYLVVQFVEGNLVMPMAQKWAVSLPPVLSLLGIVGLGIVFGPMGVLFAMPLTVVLVVLVQKLYVERLDDT
jgi:predicted PurR-regulated permease PerM